MEEPVELRIEPGTERFDPLDERWGRQVGDFVTELNHEVGGVSRTHEPMPGAKGAIGDIVLTLSSAGALTGAIELFKAWLGRDDTRSLKVSFSDGGDLQTVELAGTDVDEDTLGQIVRAMTNRLGQAGQTG
jgi:Effector Associated Constant Component 1